MNSTLTGAVAIYLAQVRAELSDLPPGELEDVLDDVSGHLTEVAAEFEGEPTIAALQERLGTPQQYADELRTAAGYPPRTQPVGDVLEHVLQLARRQVAELGSHLCQVDRDRSGQSAVHAASSSSSTDIVSAK